MGGSRPGEITPRRAARMLNHKDPQTIWRWCREGRLAYVRPEYGCRLRDGTRQVKRYWLSLDEIRAMVAENEIGAGAKNDD